MRTAIFLLALMILLSACSLVQPQQEPTTVLPTQTATITTVEQSTSTASPSPTPIPSTPTSIPSPTAIPATPTPSNTPTPMAPVATVNLLAHCRYGPGTAFLHSADLHPGDQGQVDGRNASGTWLWIQLKDLDRHCWVAASVVTVQGDMSKLPEVSSKLPYSTLYGPPKDVDAERVRRPGGHLMEPNSFYRGRLPRLYVGAHDLPEREVGHRNRAHQRDLLRHHRWSRLQPGFVRTVMGG